MTSDQSVQVFDTLGILKDPDPPETLAEVLSSDVLGLLEVDQMTYSKSKMFRRSQLFQKNCSAEAVQGFRRLRTVVQAVS